MFESVRANLENVIYTTCYSQLAAMSSLAVTNFVEVSRTVLVARASTSFSRPSLKAMPCTSVKSPRVVLASILQKKGAAYFFTGGLREALLGHLLRAGMFFPIFEIVKGSVESKVSRDLYSSMISAALTRTITSLVSFPLERARVLSQSAPAKRQSLSHAVRGILDSKRQSLSAFGFFWQKEMLFSAVFWGTYEWMREQSSAKHSLAVRLAAAALGGGLAAAATFPFDVLASYRILGPKSRSTWRLGPSLRQLWMAQGLSFFVFSFSLRVLRGIAMNCVYIGVYHTLKEGSQSLE